MYQLLRLQVCDSKEDTNDDDNCMHEDENNLFDCGVTMLCRNWRQKVEKIVRCDGTSENMVLDYIGISAGIGCTRLLHLTSAWFV